LPENTDYSGTLAEKIADRTAIVGVIGLGYVGLPLAVEFAKAGFDVVALDLDRHKVEAINAGRSYIKDVDSDEVRDVVSRGKLHATADYRDIRRADSISICVPTPLRKTKDPDISYIVSATESIAANFSPGQLIVLESTTYPGTTDEIILPRLSAGGYTVGQDFFLAFSPERVDPGNPQYHTNNIPKVIGGVTPSCVQLATALYSTVIKKVIPVSSTATAEMVKLLENTFRAVNIGLANELAIMCSKLGVDVWEVIDAAATKPFGFMPFYPGPGLGGHCIPIDPHYLSWKLKTLNYNARFIELASEINTNMPNYVLDLVADALNDSSRAIRGSRVLVLGVTYKRDTEDVRESPAIDIISLLLGKGAQADYHDPYVPVLEIPGHPDPMHSIELNEQALNSYDAVLIVTDHTSYDYNWIAANSNMLVDTRNATKNVEDRTHIHSI
jgi:UDP-N-acetyl-D-glucosamine dehydrogenase